MNNELGNHRVIEHGNFPALHDPSVHPHTHELLWIGLEHGLGRWSKPHQSPCGWQKVSERVFGVDAAFDGPTIALNFRLLQAQLFSGSDSNHPLDQVQAGDAFCHRVFDLESGIHLQKVKALVLANDKLDRTRALILNGFGQSNGLSTHGCPGFIADKG